MLVKVEMINSKEYLFEYNDNIEELEERIKFANNNDFFLTKDNTRVIIRYIITFKVIS